MNAFLESLRIQRWDDHRYYHHCRINQSLHLLSAVSFVISYVLLFIHPPAAAWLAWMVSMTSRQAGHFFFEPHEYDDVNKATHEYKEDIKVGYNLRRKVVLMSIWAASPVLLYISPSLFDLIEPATDLPGYFDHVGMGWLFIGIGGLLFRTFHLFYLQDIQTGLVWMAKIITDPFHDILLYWKSPGYLLQGERMDPMLHVKEHSPSNRS